jgi:hypothetical protein
MLLAINMKRASANMWWIIIGAVIALVVMLVLLVMFTGKTGTLERGLLDCTSKGGECVKRSDCGAPNTISSAFTCESTPLPAPQVGNAVCCFMES